ncbi:MAG: cysteine desulfurase [Culturomica sp.]|jgi:cysteine desulfurase/selenocysteine lyase|nr:cysteine desulfurase [Culturomica sp.]
MFEPYKLRADFPILSDSVHGKPLVYFDNAATSQRPLQVVEVMNDFYLHGNANVHRGVHHLSNIATDANEEARRMVKTFINAHSEREVIFTKGTTESINLVAYSFGEAFINEGDEILVTEMEHHADIVPWQLLCERKKAQLKVIPFNDKGELMPEQLDNLLTDRVKLVGVAHVSNVLGTVNPIKEIINKAHAVGAKVLIDAAQSVAHIPIDVAELDCDFLVFSAHKLYGPTGVGVLYGKEALLDKMPPWQTGGEMIKKVTFEKTTFNDLPFKFEAGTPDFIGVIGLGEAVKYVRQIGLDNIGNYENSLLDYAVSEMKKIPDIRIFGEADEKSAIISFNVGNIHHLDMGTMLDQMGIAVRTGQLCAEPVMDHYGLTGMVRASFAFYNTPSEVDFFCSAIRKVAAMFM